MYKCSKCGQEFEDDELLVKRNKKKKEWTCIDCFENEEDFYWIKLYEVVCQVNKVDKLNIRQITQLKRMKKEDKLSFVQMYYCVLYMDLVDKISSSNEKDGIGLIPYVIDESNAFWKAKWKLEDKVENLELKQKETIIKTKVVFKKEKEKHDLNFDFLEGCEDDDK